MNTPRARLSAGLCAIGISLLLYAVPAGAATTVYPGGGSAFTSNPEGWGAGEVSCNLGLLCTAEAVHESGVGNPPGSIAAKTTVTLNLLNLFVGTEVWESPKFTVAAGQVSGASIRLDRAFEPGSLVNVGPKATYVVTLRDLTAGTSATPLTEELTSQTPFATRSVAVNVVGGHAYQVAISSTTAQSTAALLSGTAALRFDNVGLVVQTPGPGAGAGPGAGGRGADGEELGRLLAGSLIGPAILKGKRIFVRVSCPTAIGTPCRITLRGMLSKTKAATRARNARIGKGKTKRLVIKVKARARPRLATRKRLLFKETVRAGGAIATVYKTLRLIRR